MNKLLSKYFFYLPATTIKGEFVLPYLPSYRKFQALSAEEIEKHQLKKLQLIVKHAYTNSAYYKNVFDNNGISHLNIKTISDIKKFPQINKNDLINSIDEISVKKWGLFNSKKTTGGSTGQAVTLEKNPSALARERAATWRSYEWAGISMGAPQARFWGVPLNSLNSLKYTVIDIVANRKRYSAFSINNSQLFTYYKSIKKFNPTYLYGYASFLNEFAVFLEKEELKLPSSIVSVITTSEVLTEDSRKNIERATNLKVYNEYGCGEVGSIAHECEYGSMHIMDDNLLVEIDNSGFSDNEGEIVVTDFFNKATPLIRYRLGDFARLSNRPCACGRDLKVLEKIHGRAYDLIYDSEGNKVHPEFIMYIFEDVKEKFNCIEQFQFIQLDNLTYNIKVIKKINYASETVEPYIIEKLNKKISPHSRVIFETVNEIERENSGKLRIIKSEL